ncbi:MAG: tetratricopeptide repeat protein [Leptospiraceae bacterium]|nr:tetratricopeptide repeat protein [Leptospiraceae bacterium]MCP5512251.1 tetratricopeptide repeat protein [Leptospiraceae bacterium]
MAKYSDEELNRIREILAPLNENPIASESLNPMAKSLRRIKGEPEPVNTSQAKEASEEPAVDGGIEVDDDSTDTYDADSPPEFKNFDDDDEDDNLDDLLNVDIDNLGKGDPESDFDEPDLPGEDDSQEDILPPAGEDPFDQTDENTTPEDDPFSSEEPQITPEDTSPEEEDPTDEIEQDEPIPDDDEFFAGLGDDTIEETPEEEEPPTETPEDNSDDPFADIDADGEDTPPSDDTAEDPFADLGGDSDPFADVDAGGEDAPPSDDAAGDDPFADLGGDSDPFGDIDAGGDTPPSDEAAGDDPFADLGGDSDPFGDIDAGGDTPPSDEVAGDDPFADLGGDSDPFGELDEASSGNEDGDPFSELDEVPDLGESTPLDTDEDAGDLSNLDIDEDGNDPLVGSEDIPSNDDLDFDAFDNDNEDTPASDSDDPFDTNSSLETVPGDDPFGAFDDTPPAQGDLEGGDAFADFDSPPSETGTSEDLGDEDILGTISEDDTAHDTYAVSLEEDLEGLMEEESAPEGEGFDLTDEELAVIQQEIIHYPPKLKRHVIDAITQEKLNPKEQRELLELIKSSQKPEDIADYLTEHLGYPVELYDNTGLYSEQGIPIISTDPVYTKKGEFERRQFIKRVLLGAAAALLLLTTSIASYKYIINPLRAASYYNDGLEFLQKAVVSPDPNKKEKLVTDAEISFKKGENINPHDLDYLNRYGMAYMKLGEYDKAFEKLFGVVEPDFGEEKSDPNHNNAWNKREEVPYITMAPGQSWNEKILIKSNGENSNKELDPKSYLRLVAQDKTERRIIKAGAYIVAELGKKIHDNETYINLARFHSNPAKDFSESTQFGDPSRIPTNTKPMKRYKNDELAINYYKQVFTDGGDPHNIEATAGLAKIYYNQESFARAASYYSKIIEAHPKNSIGHGGLISTYIEMWRKDKNPQFVLNHHRQVRNALGIESDLSLFVLTKLAGFYIDLDPTELKIRYNVNPTDQVTNMDIDDNILYILNLAFDKSESRDGIKITGDEYSEQYYQRGRYYIGKNEALRALKQFELAANYDPAHYLAVMEMGEYYIRQDNNEEAWKLLKNAEQRYIKFNGGFGNREEDETLKRGDFGRVYFNMGKIIYLGSALVNGDDKIDEFPARKVYPVNARERTESENERLKLLQNSLTYLDGALKYKLQDPDKLRELYYYRAWINYMTGDYESALAEFSNLGEEDNYENPNVMLGRANSYYYTDQINASLGNYLKIKDDFEEKEALIQYPVPEESTHQEIYQTLIAVYNNIGAIYERKGNTTQALKYYWKSIEMARKINTTTEIANYNKEMVFKKGNADTPPLLDDWLSPTIDTIKELLKSKRQNNYL